MKCRTIKIDDGAAIEKRVPPPFRGQIRFKKWGPEPVTLLLFPHDKIDVVHSRHVAHALSKIDSGQTRIVALAGCFTFEARKLLAEAGSEIFTLSDFAWTDESHERIKVPFRKRPERPEEKETQHASAP